MGRPPPIHSSASLFCSLRWLQKGAFDGTLNLPVTAFPMRANAAKREPQIQSHCMAGLYDWQHNRDRHAPMPAPAAHAHDASPLGEYVVHDGPPFANGAAHLGHFLNKALKDMVVRWKVLKGHAVSFIPGCIDTCHAPHMRDAPAAGTATGCRLR